MTEVYLPWLLSAITIYTMFLAGERKSFTWIVGLLNQGLCPILAFAPRSKTS